MNKQVVVLGGGLQGLTVSERLQSNGFDVTIVEKTDSLGGMCSTLKRKFNGDYINYDLGPHKFATRQKGASDYFFKYIFPVGIFDILSRIYLRNVWFNYPVKVFEILKKMPYVGIGCGIGFLMPKYGVYNKTYADYLRKKMGEYTYEFVFKSFATKVWGDPEKLDERLAITRVVTPSLFDIISGVLFGDKKTFKQFFYPTSGMGDFICAIKNLFDYTGGKILLNSELKSYDGNRLVVSTSSGDVEFDNPLVISTIKPRDLAIGMGIENKSIENLRYRDIHLFYYLVDMDEKFTDTWMFFPGSDVLFNRVSRSFSINMVPDGKEVVCVEVTTDEGGVVDRDVVDRQFESVFGIKVGDSNSCWYHVLRGAYPIYHLGYKNDVCNILNEFEKNGRLFCIGRHACHNYNNIDHAIIESIELAKVIIDEKQPYMWSNIRENFNWVIVD